MLKINKTKPYQFRKVHDNSTSYSLSNKLYISRVLCTLALICSVVPSLALLSNYNIAPVSAARKTLSNIATMQEMTTDICNNSALGQSNTLIDIRDNSTYTVARLSDGNCWMTQNLRLTKESLAANGNSATLSSVSSDVGTNGYTLTSSIVSETIGNSSSIYYFNDPTIGAYYAIYAATADSRKTASGKTTQYSICPKNWHLPTADEYNNLVTAGKLTSSILQSAPYNFQKSGVMNYKKGTLGNKYDGYTWTSELFSSSNYVFGVNAAVANSYMDDDAIPIRCIAMGSTAFPNQKDVEVIAVRVAPVISIDATSGMNKEVDPNLVTKGEISATISANTTYAVQLSAEKTSLTIPNNSEEITSTNSIPASSNVQAKTNAWGILNENENTYSAITSTPTTYHNTESSNADSSKTHTFTLGVSVSPTLPAGEYSTTVTITAVNN